MPSETVQQLLRGVAEIQQAFASDLGKVAEAHADEKGALLLDYWREALLKRRRLLLQHPLAEDQGSELWLARVSEMDVSSHLQRLLPTSEDGFEAIAGKLIELDRTQSQFFQLLADQSRGTAGHDALSQLARQYEKMAKEDAYHALGTWDF